MTQQNVNGESPEKKTFSSFLKFLAPRFYVPCIVTADDPQGPRYYFPHYYAPLSLPRLQMHPHYFPISALTSRSNDAGIESDFIGTARIYARLPALCFWPLLSAVLPSGPDRSEPRTRFPRERTGKIPPLGLRALFRYGSDVKLRSGRLKELLSIQRKFGEKYYVRTFEWEQKGKSSTNRRRDALPLKRYTLIRIIRD